METSDDVVALGREPAGHRQDPRVVVTEPEAGGQHRGVGVVELDSERPAELPDGHRFVEAAVLDPEVVQRPQGLAGEVAQLRMVPLGLEFGDDDDREHDLVLGEPGQRTGSASRTLVSRTYVRTAGAACVEGVPTRSPSGTAGRPSALTSGIGSSGTYKRTTPT